MTLSDYLRDVYADYRLDCGPSYLRHMGITVRMFELWYWERFGIRPSFRDLDARQSKRDLSGEQLVTGFMRYLREQGRSPTTCNGKADHLMILWRAANQTGHAKRWPRPVPKFRVPKRIPEGWTVEDVGTMVSHALPLRAEKGWTGRHWAALLMAAWDTAHRIGALLELPRSAYRPEQRLLVAPAETVKQLADHRSYLSAETCDLLDSLPDSERLFAWPWSPGYLQRKLRQRILRPCGLAEKAKRTKLMHGFRRGSVTAVYSRHGKMAASEHAGHSSLQMLRYYVDPRQSSPVETLDAIPRPRIER